MAKMKWTKSYCSHDCVVGMFRMHVWPIHATATSPYQSWALIPGDGDSHVLPSSGSKVVFASLGEAKTWIENKMREVCQLALCDLDQMQEADIVRVV